MTTVANAKLNGEITILNHVQYEHLVGGFVGGLTSTLILHPLDLIKIRFAVNDGRQHSTPQYKSIRNAFVTIFRQEGVYGLYRGVMPSLWGASSSWGLYLLFYNTLKVWTQGGNAEIALGPAVHLLYAAEAGILTLLLTNPIWVVKTRLCLQYSSPSGSNSILYNGMIDALKKIYAAEGLRGYYKGLVPGMLGVSHGAVQFMVYEEMKNRYNLHRNVPINEKLGSMEYLTFSAVSKVIAAGSTYPYQLIRARLQNQHNLYVSMTDCVKQTWHHEGWRGFYKGLGTNLLKVTPATMITFLTYENVSHFLSKRKVNK